ncbi:hypothetical protein FC90_GL000555 [Latilactobacillus graminis DSM 20719]|uniref:WxL domain-containing protein n=2 Tax=Latilactobacillus graminis TaxID=60519 RepID=A0AA89L1J3_9LACO|nr:hypothetical protein FC90_GL000555 [Latilactobacillus graminis DSM 20719]
MFLTATMFQSLGGVWAATATKPTNATSRMSKLINPQQALASTNVVSESLASSLSGQSSSRSETSSSTSQTSEVTSTKASSKTATKQSTAQKATSSQSVLIQPQAEEILDPDSDYPDFSKTLSSQAGVTTVSYDNAGNAHTAIADASGTLVPDDSKNEIPYPYNAFPVYVPGVSTEEDHGQAAESTEDISGAKLDSANDYIMYKKVMLFRDNTGIQHWIDIKQSFVGLEKHGWYNDWPQYKAKGYISNFPSDTDNIFINEWSFRIGKGKYHGDTDYQDMLGMAGTYNKGDAFRSLSLKSGPKGAYINVNPTAYLQYREVATAKLEFFDDATGKPIKISGFLTAGDMDHRDFLQFSKDSHIDNVYVTNNQNSQITPKGTYNSDADPSTIITNSIGNNDYYNYNGDYSKTDYGGDGDMGNIDLIKPEDTDAWTTVTFHDTDSIQYGISDGQRLDFLATSLVPVAFSAPGKSGDGDTWNQDWDDNAINYNVVATLPYRGSTITNPQDTSFADHTTISTFHPATKFTLTDPINQNLKVDKVIIKRDGQTDVSDQFEISTDGNQVVANAKAEFLNNEANYTKTYNMTIETSVAADADLSSLPTVTANGHTYVKIANTANLDVIKAAGSTEQNWDSNEAYGHVKVPDPIREVQDLQQTIKNDDTPSEDWQPVVDNISKTTGNVGDQIGYRFAFKAKTTNTASITDAMINQIQMNPDDGLSAPVDDSINVTVGGKAGKGTLVKTATNDYAIKIETPIKAGQDVVVTFKRTATKAGTYGQTGRLKAESLTEQPTANATDAGNLFNEADITIKASKNTASFEQDILNATTNGKWHGPMANDEADVNAVPGDKVRYLFRVKLGAKNTDALLKAAMQDIVMNVPDDMQLVDFDDSGTKIKITYGKEGAVNLTSPDSFADLKELNFKSPLGTANASNIGNSVLQVEFIAQVKLNALAQVVSTDANLYASNLDGTLTDTKVDNYQHKVKANQSRVHIINKKQVKLEQTLKNETTADNSSSSDPNYPDQDGYRQTTTGVEGDVINYRFKVSAADDNTGDITNMRVKAITMKKPDKLSFTDPDTHQDYPLVVKISKADGTDVTTDTGAQFSTDHQTITLTKPLKPGYVATINYKMIVTAKIDDNTVAADKQVTNDGQFTADQLTETKQTADGTEDVAVVDNTLPFNQTVLNLKKSDGEIIIRYVDLEDDNLSEPTYISKEVDAKGSTGQKLSTVVPERVAPKVIDGYTVYAVTEDTDLTNANWAKAYKDDPVFTNKVRIITYGYYKRMLSVQAPSDWYFGKHSTSQTDSTYYLKDAKTPQSVKVTDHYGVDSWQLQVSQDQPFIGEQDQVLKDAQLQFKNGKVIAATDNTTPAQALTSIKQFNLEPGATVKNLMTYTKSGVFQDPDLDKDKSSASNRYNQGNGSWAYQFGNPNNADISIGLHVPETSKRYQTYYATILDWTLTVAP